MWFSLLFLSIGNMLNDLFALKRIVYQQGVEQMPMTILLNQIQVFLFSVSLVSNLCCANSTCFQWNHLSQLHCHFPFIFAFLNLPFCRKELNLLDLHPRVEQVLLSTMDPCRFLQEFKRTHDQILKHGHQLAVICSMTLMFLHLWWEQLLHLDAKLIAKLQHFCTDHTPSTRSGWGQWCYLVFSTITLHTERIIWMMYQRAINVTKNDF